MNYATINKKRIPVAGKYNELSKRQLLRIAKVQLSETSTLRKRVLFLKILLWKNNAFFKRLPDAGIADLLLLTDFLFEKDKDTYVLSAPKITKQLIPFVRIRFTKYYGPGDLLNNISVMEWGRAEKYFLRFHKSHSVEDLNNLVAVLYRPLDKNKKITDKDYNGDMRLKYNDFTHFNRVKHFARMDITTRHAIFMYYTACRDAIFKSKKYAEVFDGQESKTIKSNTDFTWIDFIMDLSGKNFDDKSIDTLADSLLHTVLYKLNRILLLERK